MQSLRKVKSRRGATSMFLAIILSALILVECTYVALVDDLRCGLAFERGVKLQVDTYLAEYDRQLFKTYGIYAFNIDSVDDTVLRQVLSESGVEYGDELVVSGVNTFDTEDLRRAIAVFYSYRASGVLIDFFSDYIVSLLRQIDDIAIVEGMNSMSSSGAANIVMQILDKSIDVSSYLTQLAEDFGITDADGNIVLLDDLIDKIDDLDNSPPDIGDDFDPSDLSFLTGLTEGAIEVYDVGADFIENIAFHGYAVNYAAYNFDCCLDGDTAIDGTPFSTFHSEEQFDTEYILTGMEGRAGCVASYAMIYGLLFLKNIVAIVADQEKMTGIRELATFLSVLIEVISVGTVPATPEVCEAVIVGLMAEYYSSQDLNTVLSGGEVYFLAIDGFDGFALDYRDMLCIFMNYVPDSFLLTRMHDVLSRDLEGYVCGVSVSAEFRGKDYSYDSSYELYQEVSYEAA